MPTITFRKKLFDEALGKTLPFERLADELEHLKVEAGGLADGVLTVEVTGDRPDLMSAWGIARALKGRLGMEKGVPKIKVHPSALKIIVDPAAAKVRPVIVGAVVEGAKFDDDGIADLFVHQEKLDMVIGRKRKRVSIGLYDMARLKPPFRFTMIPGTARFQPLKSDVPMSVAQILAEHPTGMAYAHLLSSCQSNYPAFLDSAGEVLSLVPIVNGVSSAVTASTTRFFIDHTGTDESACNASLANMCQDFYEQGFNVSGVTVEYPQGAVRQTPVFTPQELSVSSGLVNRSIGAEFTSQQIISLLSKCRIDGRASGDSIDCGIPAYRADFLHPADLVEEVAMAFGYNNFEPKMPTAYTKGGVSASTLLQDEARDFMAGAGYTEYSGYILTSPSRLARAGGDGSVVEIVNPVSDEYTSMRNSLLPGLLEMLSKNTHVPYPQRVFEVGEVVVPDHAVPERCRTSLRMAAVSCHAESSLTEVASALARYAQLRRLKLSLTKLSNNQFIDGRAAEVDIGGRVLGRAGEISPQILVQLGLQMPVSGFEMVLE